MTKTAIMTLLRKRGFTLVEMMIVVAVIGVLAAIAIPNYRTYQAKAKTVEAKLALSSAWMIEESAFATYDSYLPCLSLLGYGALPGYYAQGLGSGAGTPLLPACGNQVLNDTYYGSTKSVGAGIIPAASYIGAFNSEIGTVGTKTTYTIGACGIVDRRFIMSNQCFFINTAGENNPDAWTINEQKNLIHFNVGY